MFRVRRLLIFFFLLLSCIVTSVIITQAFALARPEQPIAYSHRTHIEAGVECIYCHSGVMRSAIAGIPSVQLCMGCHEVIAKDDPVVQQVAAYWERGEPIPWARVNLQPDFVYFSHQPHLVTGINCETCHGNVGQMDTAQPVVIMDMGWCLDCHLDQAPGEAERLADCLICHK